jgi:ABC-type Fe3+/spermidine/putrescine transport system ATPase subunit
MPFLRIEGLAKSFGEQRVLDGVDLSVVEGEILALLGPSGSGKTTLLRLLAGFESPDKGEIWLGKEAMSPLPPARRGFGMVFQHYALFPHLTVGENVAFGLHGRGLPEERIAQRVAEVLQLVDLEGFESRRISEISGGQQQRVAVARALAPKPRLLLLDEPLSNLDPELRERTRQRLKRTLRATGVTTILVTHEQDEAFDLGNRVAVLNDGRLEQVAAPEALYRWPATLFVAGFVGRASVLTAQVGDSGGVVVGQDASGDYVTWDAQRADGHEPGEAAVAVRPEALELVPAGTPRALAGRVVERRFSGASTYVVVKLDDGQRIEVVSDSDADEGSAVGVVLRADAQPPRAFPLPKADGS